MSSETKLPNYSAISPSGRYEEVPEYSYESGGILQKQYMSKLGLVDANDSDMWMYMYNNYPYEMIINGYAEFYGDYGIVKLLGVDGEKYYTLIDKKGIQQFEPIRYMGEDSPITFSDGVITYCSYYRYDTKYAVVNTKGQSLIPDTKGYSFIGAFYDGIAIAQNDDNGVFFINTNGEHVLTNLCEK